MKKALLLSVLSFGFMSPAFAMDEHGAVTHPAAVVEPVSAAPVPHETVREHWGYVGSESANKWGDLAAEYETCKIGVKQSPINIDRYMQTNMPPLNLAYAEVPLEVSNNGHTVKVNYAPGSGFSANGKDFQLLQFHFHTPSEHYIDGAPYPMEVHFVHRAADGTLAVVGVMMKVGKHNPVIEGIWQNVPPAGETKNVDAVMVNAAALLPADQSYFTYDGSLTTPPCSEGVQWFVMKDPIELSREQLTAFQAVFPVNARSIQAIGERIVQGN